MVGNQNNVDINAILNTVTLTIVLKNALNLPPKPNNSIGRASRMLSGCMEKNKI